MTVAPSWRKDFEKGVHKDGYYVPDLRLQDITDAYRLFIVVSDRGEAHTPEARKAFEKVLTTLDTLIDRDALTENNDG